MNEHVRNELLRRFLEVSLVHSRIKTHPITEDEARSLCGENYRLAINADKGIYMLDFVNNVKYNSERSAPLIVKTILRGLGAYEEDQHLMRNLTLLYMEAECQ